MPRGEERAPPRQRRVATTFLISTVIIAVVYQSRAGRSEGLGDGRKEKDHAWDGTGDGGEPLGDRERKKRMNRRRDSFFPQTLPNSGSRGALKNKWSQRLWGISKGGENLRNDE